LRFSALLAGQAPAAARLLESLQVDDAKIRGELGWTPPHGMVQGLADMADWFTSRDES
jgi:nucleoside-diphosphate-sugar epimerase